MGHPSTAQGGDLGYFARGQSGFGERFEVTAFAMAAGTPAPEPVAIHFGFNVIEAVDRQQMKPTLDEVRDSLHTQLENQKISLLLDQLCEATEISTIIEVAPGAEGSCTDDPLISSSGEGLFSSATIG